MTAAQRLPLIKFRLVQTTRMSIFWSYRRWIGCVFALWLMVAAAGAQPMNIQGIGLSGNSTSLDTSAAFGDTVFAVVSFNRNVGVIVGGLALDPDHFNVLTIHYYSQNIPQQDPVGSVSEFVIFDAMVIDTVNQPNTIRFPFVLTNPPPVQSRSLQVELGLYGFDENQILFLTEHRASEAEVGGVPPANNPVDTLHTTYLHLHDAATLPPQIFVPADGAVLGSNFEVVFNLPEEADSGSLFLLFSDVDSPIPELPRFVYLSDPSPGPARLIQLNAAALDASRDVDSVEGPNQLTHLKSYRMVLSYQDVAGNPAASDTVFQLLVDTRTETPDLIEPNQQSESPNNDIRLLFSLPEQASVVQFTFAIDSLSPVPDLESPHILTLASQFDSAGLHLIYLDGLNIGTNNPIVINNNHGAIDALVSQALYSVTLFYADTVGNAPAFDTNTRYMFPRDLATIRPDILAPVTGTHEDETFWVQFYIPEQAYPGSVRLIFRVQGSFDPGSPHTLTFGTLVAPGVRGIMLNAQQFRYSDLVTDVSGPGTPDENNTLVHNSRYRLELSYRDYRNNSVSGDTVNTVTFDIATETPTIVAPAPGDSLSRLGTDISFILPEIGLPGTIKAILTQTGGPEEDLGSPHTLFATFGTAFEHLISLQPVALGASTGIDSVHNDGSLTPLGIYRLTVEYQDTLGNPAASDAIEGLHFPSGAAVFVEGHNYGNQSANPGGENLVFLLGARTFAGISVLRGLQFLNDGDLIPADLLGSNSRLWVSADTLWDTNLDTSIATLGNWLGGDLVFTSFALPLTENEIYVFVTLAFSTGADPNHTVNLTLLGPESVDCGGDPVYALSWPIGQRDVPLPVELLSFQTQQDTAFGALRVIWRVASELNNEGFNVRRRAENEEEFHTVASFTNTPSLAGRGTAPTSGSYSYTDRGLAPGRTYYYQLESVSSVGFEAHLLVMEASGVPRMPPNDFILSDAYPNPFNQDVTIQYVVPFSAEVNLQIFDVTGRPVRTLVRALLPPSEYKAHWDSRSDQGIPVSSGLYFYRFRAGGTFDQTKKLLLIR